MAIMFCCCRFSNLEIVGFSVGNNILWDANIAQGSTIFIKIFPEEHASGPPSTNLAPYC